MAFDPRSLNWAALAGLASGNTVGEQFGNANAIMAQQAQQAQTLQSENATRAWLAKQFPNQDFSQLSGQALGNAFNVGLQQYAQAQQPKKPNLMNIGNGYLYNADNGQYIQPPQGFNTQNQTTYGKQPIWFRDQTGALKLGVPGDDGTLKELNVPQGYEPLPGVSNVDLGTTNVTRNNKTGEIVTSSQKDIAGVKEQEKVGTELGAIKAALPSARLTAQNVSKQIKELKDDPGLSSAVGPIDSRLPTFSPATATAEARIRQLEGQAFLQAREMLRGGGQITDYEGQRAENAIARLSTAQSEADFKKALEDFDSAVQAGLAKLEAAASGQDYNPSQTPQQPGSNVQSLVDKYRTK
jgi:hypothetical protein